MPPGRRRLLAAVAAAVLIAAGAIALLCGRATRSEYGPRPEAERPELLLLTSLPIVFPEEFTLAASGSPVLGALQERYRVVPISVADRGSLATHKLLLMAQPRAQPAELLVELDEWLREGGRVLLLADPLLRWPSERPLGDVLRPPATFSDTGLLMHWGMRLDAPVETGTTDVKVGERRVRTAAAGELFASSGDCTVEPSRLVARCRIGKGEATVIADADFIDLERFRDSGSANLAMLLDELARLDH